MELPFGQLSWENFERLCHRLAERDGQVESASRYGRQGQAQQGIDIFARLSSGRYEVWQAKRYRTFTATQLRKAVKAFLDGSWVGRTERLVIAIQATLDDVVIQDEIERQTTALAGKGVILSVMGGDRLLARLEPHQDLVLAFFGRAWLEAFYGPAVDRAVADRLDGGEFARIREQLARIYSTRFSVLDQSIVAPRFAGAGTRHDPLGLLDRYAMTDVWVRDRVTDEAANPPPMTTQDDSPAPLRPRGREDLRRQSVASWLADGDQIAVIADAGAGKSTLLRCIALDILSEQSTFPSLCARWSDKLPLVISFAKWARLTAETGNEVSLKTVVAATLQPLMTTDFVPLVNRAIDERRVVLVVDGLDEWSTEQAARLTLQTLLTYVEVHQIPTIVSGRPHGLQKIGALPGFWKTAELAPLSEAQQRELANSWFNHLGDAGVADAPSLGGWAADRFLRELRADAALGELAETPLLFIGLLALSVRDVALPRNRTQALQSLTRLLLEIHPQTRATAAGDVAARFDVASSWELRQSALAVLAFVSRREGGDGGYPRASAERVIRDHLVEANGYEPARAAAAASEMLAVNAETVGLIVEKAPGDIGFAHASLEEYLSAVHIQTWPFTDLTAFVSAQAGNPRWRNVLRNLVAINTRTSEINDIVEAIESASVDVFGAFNRQILLAEITFGPSMMAPPTAWRLAEQTFDVIDSAGPETERTSLLRIALNGLSDPTLGERVGERLRRWAPRRYRYTSGIYHALRDWPADNTLLEILVAGLRDADRHGARSAAGQLAARFANSEEVGLRLRALISGSTDLHVVAATIEALVLGWPCDETDRLVERARASRSPLLRAVAIWARTHLGIQDDADLTETLRLISFEGGLDYSDKDIAEEALIKGWPDNDRVVRDAIAALGNGPTPRDTIDRDLATPYLLGVAPGRPEVDAWMLEELRREHPFVLLSSRSWAGLVKHCEANEEIREGVIQKILSDDMRYREHDVWKIVASIKDVRLRDQAIAKFRSKEHRAEYWTLLPLLVGWRDDPEAQAVFEEALALPDDQMQMLVTLLPDLYGDPGLARARLLQIARTAPKARWDLIVQALAELGSDGTDEEAVAAILPHARSPSRTIGSADGMFAIFGQSDEVRAVALSRLDEIDAPLAFIARGMPDDAAVRARVFDVASAAPHALRASIVTAYATSGDRHPALSAIAHGYDREVDFQLRVQLAIDYYRLQQARPTGEAHVDRLRAEANRVGPDWEDNRASAFAGLIVLGRADIMLEGDRPRDILIGSYHRGGVSGALCALIVEHWDDLKIALGDDFPGRIKSLDGSAWSSLCRYVGQNPSARADFLAWCEATDQIGLTALRSLADLAPRSDLLRTHLIRVLEPPLRHERNVLPAVVGAATLLRDQFPADAQVDRMRDHFQETRNLVSALALAVVRPADPLLADRSITAIELGETHNEWLGAVELAARLESADQVVAFVPRLAERRPGVRWSQSLSVEALVERIRRDPEVREGLRAGLTGDTSPDAFAAMARLLSSAAALDDDAWRRCTDRLAEERASDGLPVAVLDVLADEIRPMSHVLMDLVDARAAL